jgi:hypothetical protein
MSKIVLGAIVLEKAKRIKDADWRPLGEIKTKEDFKIMKIDMTLRKRIRYLYIMHDYSVKTVSEIVGIPEKEIKKIVKSINCL